MVQLYCKDGDEGRQSIPNSDQCRSYGTNMINAIGKG